MKRTILIVALTAIVGIATLDSNFCGVYAGCTACAATALFWPWRTA
jgi:hypothetical protein